jgi:hypothetical protein
VSVGRIGVGVFGGEVRVGLGATTTAVSAGRDVIAGVDLEAQPTRNAKDKITNRRLNVRLMVIFSFTTE